MKAVELACNDREATAGVAREGVVEDEMGEEGREGGRGEKRNEGLVLLGLRVLLCSQPPVDVNVTGLTQS